LLFAICYLFFFSSRRRHTRSKRDWSSDVCSSDLSSDIFTTFSKDTSQLLNLSSTLRARIGVGPATPNDRRKSTIFFLSSDNFTYATVPIVAISIAFLIAYFIYLP